MDAEFSICVEDSLVRVVNNNGKREPLLPAMFAHCFWRGRVVVHADHGDAVFLESIMDKIH